MALIPQIPNRNGLGCLFDPAVDVRIGSKADIQAPSSNVRFTPKSGHWITFTRLPRWHVLTLPGQVFEFRTRLCHWAPSRRDIIAKLRVSRRTGERWQPIVQGRRSKLRSGCAT
jgi:hypothetical protein